MPPVLGAAIVAKSSKDFDDVLRLYRPDASFQLMRVRDNVTGGVLTMFDGSNNTSAQLSGDVGLPSYVLQLGIGTTNPIATLDVIGNARITGPLTVSSFAVGPSIANLGINSVGGITTAAGFTSQWISTGTGLIYYSNALTDKVIIGVPYRINPFWKTSIVADDSPFLLSVENNNAITNTGAAATLTRTNGPWGARTPLSINDEIGSLNFAGSAAAALNISAASLRSVADAAWSGTSGPSRLDFYTTNVNTTVTSLAMTIKSNGNVGIGTPSLQTKFEVNGNAKFLGPVTISGFAGGTSVYTLGINSLGGIVTIAGLATNFWTVSGSNLIPISNYNIALNSVSGAFMVGTNTGLKMSDSGSLFLGNNAGNTTLTGSNNFIFGIGSGNKLSTGPGNIVIGGGSGTSLTSSNNNIFLGPGVGNNIGTIASSDNVMIGNNAGGAANSANGRNVLIGYYTSRFMNGDQNVYVGSNTGELAIGSQNTGVGPGAGQNANGNQNVYLGFNAGQGTHSGNSNTALGPNANIVGAGINNAVAIGNNATVGGSNMMALGGAGVNAVKVGIGTGLPATTLDVNGNARFLGPVSISGFATGSSVYILGVNSLGGIVTLTGGNLSGSRGGNSTGIAYWSGANTLTSNPAFYWNNATSTLGIGGTLIKATGAAADNNFFVGQLAGTVNSTGFYNNFLGLNAGSGNTIGNANNFLGAAAGQNNVDGSYNNFLGFYAGASNQSGTENNFLGSSAGNTNISGSYNIAIGYNADVALGTLTNAIAIGYKATVGGSNMMALGGTGGNIVKVGIGTGLPSTTLDVNGNARFLGPVSITGFATGRSVYTLGVNSLGGIVTISGSNTGVQGSRSSTNTGIAYWNGTNTLTSSPIFNWNTTSSSVGINNLNIGGAGANIFMTQNKAVMTITGALSNIVIGSNNTGIGLTSGNNNILIGEDAGTAISNSGDNVFVGRQAGINSTSSRSVLIGYYAGRNASGAFNVIIGGDSPGQLSIGNRDIIIGNGAGQSNSGDYNIIIGENAGLGNTPGSYNIALGGNTQIVGTGVNNSVAIGNNATVGGSNMMSLGGTGANAVKVGIGTGLPSTTLDVNGNARFLGPVSITGFATGSSVYTLGINSLGGIVTVSGGSVATGFSGFTSTDVTLGVSTTQISFDGENYDKASALSGTTYLAPSAGEYLFTASATTNNIGQVDLLLLKNGTIVKEVRISPTPNSGVYNTAQLTAFLDLNLSDSITVIIRQYTGIPQTLFSLSGTGTTLSGKKIF